MPVPLRWMVRALQKHIQLPPYGGHCHSCCKSKCYVFLLHKNFLLSGFLFTAFTAVYTNTTQILHGNCIPINCMSRYLLLFVKAGHHMSVSSVCQCRAFLCTALCCIFAAGTERASGRHVQRTWHITLKNDTLTLLGHLRIRIRHCT